MSETEIDWSGELRAAGWVEERRQFWREPGGGLHLGPYGAWRAMKALQLEAAAVALDPRWVSVRQWFRIMRGADLVRRFEDRAYRYDDVAREPAPAKLVDVPIPGWPFVRLTMTEQEADTPELREALIARVTVSPGAW